MYARNGGRGQGVGVEGCSLILEENVEEINLNYKDEASLESGSGKGYTGKGSTGNRHYGPPFFSRHVFVFLFFSSMRGLLFLSLSCHPKATLILR